MKMKFLTILFLIFSLQSWTNADEIDEFSIEGISIGDSLLSYFSVNEINNAPKIFDILKVLFINFVNNRIPL